MGGDSALPCADRSRHLAVMQLADHVAGGKDVRHTCPQMRIDLDLATPVHGDASDLQADPFRVGSAARRDQQLLRTEGATTLTNTHLRDHAPAGDVVRALSQG